MNAQVKTGLTHLGTAVGGAMAVMAFVSANKVDLYAVWDQLNVVIAAITQLIAIATPIATALYGIVRSSTKNRIAEIANDPSVKGVITTPEIANSKPLAAESKVVSSVAALPQEAKNA